MANSIEKSILAYMFEKSLYAVGLFIESLIYQQKNVLQICSEDTING